MARESRGWVGGLLREQRVGGAAERAEDGWGC